MVKEISLLGVDLGRFLYEYLVKRANYYLD